MQQPDQRTRTGLLRSRAGIVLLAFLAIAGLLLGYEHRAHLLTGDGVLVVLLLLCVGMHLFMRGGHGGHDGHGDGDAGPGQGGRS